MTPASASADLGGLPCALSPANPGAATHTASPWPCVPSPRARRVPHPLSSLALLDRIHDPDRGTAVRLGQIFWLSKKTLTLASGRMEQFNATLSWGRGDKTDDSVPMDR